MRRSVAWAGRGASAATSASARAARAEPRIVDSSRCAEVMGFSRLKGERAVLGQRGHPGVDADVLEGKATLPVGWAPDVHRIAAFFDGLDLAQHHLAQHR